MNSLFAIARIAGWDAHIIGEKAGKAQETTALYGPRAEYVGQHCGLMGAVTNRCRKEIEMDYNSAIIFRSARMNGSRIQSPAYLTAFHNGLVIHNNVHLPGVTGEAIDSHIEKPGPILLQDHGDPVSFRNIWAVSLPLKGSDAYEPR
jgi:hypothetical protein